MKTIEKITLTDENYRLVKDLAEDNNINIEEEINLIIEMYPELCKEQ